MDAPYSTHINGYRSGGGRAGGRAHHKAFHIQCMTMMIMIIIMMAYYRYGNVIYLPLATSHVSVHVARSKNPDVQWRMN
jgi:hypothetical protein